ncbi:RNA polymerase sigma factor [Lachnospiraceae bacterium C1.1]|nr:sigma-70 family RNA polymerase sigma factor [Lachnospiraceae bacterium C1.1]
MEKKSFNEVYSENFSYIYNFIYMRIVHKETTEDLCSQTFLNALAHYDSYDVNKASVKTWLCTIARNLILNYLNSSAVKLAVPMPEDDNKAFSREDEYPVFNDPANREATRLLLLLNENDRKILSLRYGLELSISEIAAYYGITENAVRKRITKALGRCYKNTGGGMHISDLL